MTTDLKTLLSSRLPNDRSANSAIKQLSVDAVDKLADELADEYSNPKFRQWYCGVIYEFGFSKVTEWRGRAKEGNEPAKLFSKYVVSARTYRGSRSDSNA
jgi:hypothetical protein